MFNIAVIRLRDILKYLMVIFIAIIIIIFAKKKFTKINFENIKLGQKVSNNLTEYIQKAIEVEMPVVEHFQNEEEQLVDETLDTASEGIETKILSKMIELELGKINIQDKILEIAQNEGAENVEAIQQKQEENENIELAQTNVKTEVITKNPLSDAYTKKYKSVKIKNETSFELPDEVLNYDNLKIDKSNIIIFHTHTCESYTSSEKYAYTPTGKYRTTDLNFSVAKVGDELEKYLKQYNFKVIHNKTYHDYPSYNGSYSRSLKTVTNLLKNTKADIVIDLHRDAIGSNSNYAPTVKIGEDTCAQIMFVMGTSGGGLNHPNWKTNLQFAVKMQELANKTYPGLFKPIILRNSRYNQHLSKAACIIEVGATGNTLEQCLNSMKYLAEIMNQF